MVVSERPGASSSVLAITCLCMERAIVRAGASDGDESGACVEGSGREGGREGEREKEGTRAGDARAHMPVCPAPPSVAAAAAAAGATAAAAVVCAVSL